MEPHVAYNLLLHVIWRDKVRDAIVTIYGKNDIESMIRILIYLQMDTVKAKSEWTTLITLLQLNPNCFKQHTDEIVADTKRNDEVNEIYHNTMVELIGELGTKGSVISRKKDSDAENMGFEVISSTDIVLYGVRQLLKSVIPLTLLRQIIINHQTILCIDEFVSLVNKSAGSIVMVGLASLHIGFVVIRQLWGWWNGKITGVRCIKTIIDSTVMATAGVVGGMAGGAAGLCLGPVGVFVGGILGSIWSAEKAHYFSERMTRKLFGIPKDISLENAYKYFGTDMNAPNKDINKLFHKLCLQHHPDKGGNSEDFIELQLHMGVIKLARGDMTM